MGLGRRRHGGTEEARRVSSLLLVGRTRDAIREIAHHPLEPQALAEELAPLRERGLSREADLVALAAVNRRSRPLLGVLTFRQSLVLRAPVFASFAALVATDVPGSVRLGVVGASFLLVALWLVWLRMGLTREQWQLVLERWAPARSAAVRLAPIPLAVAAGFIALVALGNAHFGWAAVSGLVAAGAAAIPLVTLGRAARTGRAPFESPAAAVALEDLPVTLPVVIERPAFILGLVPAAVAVGGVLAILSAAPALVVVGVVGLAVSVFLGRRFWATRLVIDEHGVWEQRLVTVRRTPWAEIHQLRSQPTGGGGSAVKMVTTSGAERTIYDRSGDPGQLLDVVTVGAQRATGSTPPPQGRNLLLFAGIGLCAVAVFFATPVALIAPFAEPSAVVRPEDVPPGTDLTMKTDERGRMTGGPFYECSPLLFGDDRPDPPPCDGARRDSLRVALVSGAIAVAAGGTMIWLIRLRRRGRRSNAPVQPFPSAAPVPAHWPADGPFYG